LDLERARADHNCYNANRKAVIAAQASTAVEEGSEGHCGSKAGDPQQKRKDLVEGERRVVAQQTDEKKAARELAVAAEATKIEAEREAAKPEVTEGPP